MITEELPTLQIHSLTQEQYDAAFAAGTLDENAIYLTTDDNVALKNTVVQFITWEETD